jgi:phospholipid transport system substrate-binding protein
MESSNIMKKLFTVMIALALMVSISATAKAVDSKNPYAMIETVAKVTFKRFSDEQPEIRKNPEILKDIVREELMPYINYRYAALKVIGFKNFEQTTSQSRADFVDVFREYLVTSYAQVFTLYKQQEVEFEPERDFDDAKVVAVRTSVLDPGRPPIDISFRVRRNTTTNEWKAYDMVAEGVSLLDSKEAELSGLIRQKGLPYVTEMLKEKSDQKIVFK